MKRLFSFRTPTVRYNLASMDVGALQPLDGDERWDLVKRIVASPRFEKSPRLQQFLLFIAERSLTGRSSEITEYAIGWEVFERTRDYNPLTDSIVRTAARQLRIRLKEYFDEEGNSESLILDVPKGGYGVVFAQRDVQQGYKDPPLNANAEPVTSTASTIRLWRIVAGILGFVSVCSLALTYRFWWYPAYPAPKEGGTIASAVLVGGAIPTRIVVGDYGAVLLAMASKRRLSVEEYANRSYLETISDVSNPVFSSLSRPTVSLPDLRIAETLLRLSWKEQRDVVVKHAREINAQDLRSGNIVLLSSPVANPWIGLFEDRLNFRFHVRYDTDVSGGSSQYVNVRPAPGEQMTYPGGPTAAPKFGLAYGLVARVPNLAGTGKVLLICGQKFTGFRAAGEYATDPKAATELARLLNAKNVKEMPDFEVLLETYSIDFIPQYVKPVAFRRIGN